ncbi:MAG: hypothetical protein CM1200mP3_18080 [Chloroflexota bacterium]|nr:MAG: hypothetical protein CM1200mP3_18080 [Chloroflexota bacterium]
MCGEGAVLDLSVDELNTSLFARRVHGFGFLDGTLDPSDFITTEEYRMDESQYLDKMEKAQTRAKRLIDLSETFGFDHHSCP